MSKLRRFTRVHALIAVVGLVGTLGGAAALGANGSVAYTYDALGRIATANYDTGVCITYQYDLNGNRTAQTIQVVGTGGQTIWGCFNWGQANWLQ